VIRLLARMIITVAAAVTLAACGSGDDTTSATSSASPRMPGMSAAPTAGAEQFTAQDEAFASDMIVHHRQAVQMATMAPDRSTDQKVLDLAKRIEAAQQPEIDTMSGWLEAWGSAMPEDMSGHDMGEAMPGMMSAADMADLEGLKGSAFDQKFLSMMIAHHEGAITMAETQAADGMDPAAIALAKTIITAQAAEITEMRGLVE
jgi:uncharacterized protein (DUF305 family)